MSKLEPWRVFFALGDENRLAMLRRLGERGPLAMLQLVEGFPFTRQAGAKHVDVLAAAGLVTVTAKGRQRVVVLQPENLHLTQLYMAHIESVWNDRLSDLEALVQE